MGHCIQPISHGRYFTSIDCKSKLKFRTWIQAEYKGLKGSKRWKDWNNKKLKNIAWYDSINDSQDEPTKVPFYQLVFELSMQITI